MEVPRISEAEWLVMKVLWAESPRTAMEIIDALSLSTSWKPKTIKSLLSRLVKKNAIGFNNENRSYLYYPLVSENDCVITESESFLDRIFDGALNQMLASFVERKKLSREEISELKKILDSMDCGEREKHD